MEMNIYILMNIYTHTIEYYSAVTKNEILPFATTQMDLEGIMFNGMSTRERQILYYHLYLESKNKTLANITKKETVIDIEDK